MAMDVDDYFDLEWDESDKRTLTARSHWVMDEGVGFEYRIKQVRGRFVVESDGEIGTPERDFFSLDDAKNYCQGFEDCNRSFIGFEE